MKILFVCNGKLDVKQWSGTTYNIYKRLSLHNEIEVLELYEEYTLKAYLMKILNFFTKRILNKKIMYARDKTMLEKYKCQVENKLSDKAYDCIFSSGSLPVTLVNSSVPIYIYIDGTVALMHNYYDEFSNLFNWNYNKINYFENMALKNSSLIFSSSDWLVNSLQHDYNVPSENIEMVRIGANMSSYLDKNNLKMCVDNRVSNGTINFLFIGVDYERKGLRKVVKVIEYIESKNNNVHLDIVGGSPNIDSNIDYTVYGFLNKDDENDLRKINNLYLNATYFILLTEAECVGAVFCEAASFGLPVISTNTGGIGSVVNDGKTGMLFNCNEKNRNIGDSILENYKNKQAYKEMSYAAYEKYTNELNWDVIVRRMEKSMKNKKIM